jgi:hypothetical protein
LEAAQKLNRKIIKRFVRPVKKAVEKNIVWRVNPSPLDVFRTEARNAINVEAQK